MSSSVYGLLSSKEGTVRFSVNSIAVSPVDAVALS